MKAPNKKQKERPKPKYDAQKDLKQQRYVNLIIALVVTVLVYIYVVIPMVGTGTTGLIMAIFGFFVVMGLASRMTEKQVADRKIINK